MTGTTLNCGKLVEQYIRWLRSNITAVKSGEACEITTPFLDRHNDFLQFYVVPSNGRFRLTDDGNTIRDLELSGVDLRSERRARLLALTLNGLGVSRHGDELVIEALTKELPQKQHALVQAMLAVNDMFVTASPLVESLFHEDVERYLRLHRVRFTPNVQFVGLSRFVHNFDFVVPASDVAPERILRAINRPGRDSVTGLLFAWSDTKGVRPSESRLYAFLNDEERAPSGALVAALGEYQVEVVLWSERERYRDQLAA